MDYDTLLSAKNMANAGMFLIAGFAYRAVSTPVNLKNKRLERLANRGIYIGAFGLAALGTSVNPYAGTALGSFVLGKLTYELSGNAIHPYR